MASNLGIKNEMKHFAVRRKKGIVQFQEKLLTTILYHSLLNLISGFLKKDLNARIF